MIVVNLVGAITLAVTAVSSAAGADGGVESSVVKVFVRTRTPEMLKPWKLGDPESTSGSGVIISEERILTAAHIVDDHIRVEVQRADDTKRYRARVIQIAYPCDLALLTVDDPDFFRDSEPLTLGDMAPAGATVRVAGFPIGGDSIALTEGIVSRYGLGQYPTSREEILRAQVDAPLNPGISGGPALREGAAFGIASASMEDAENVGYVVPAPVIKHFLEDMEDGRFDGFPRIGAWWQRPENEAQRRFFKLDRQDEGGFLLTSVLSEGTGSDELKRGDVITAIDGVMIGRDGTVEIADRVRVDAEYLIEKKQVGEPALFSVLRSSGKYVVFAGIVFQPLSLEYIYSFENLPFNLTSYVEREAALPSSTKELVVLSGFLEHRVNEGYRDHEDELLAQINGKPVHSLEDVARELDDVKGKWLELTTDVGSSMVFDVEQARSSLQAVMHEYDMKSDRSENLSSLPAKQALR
jgi:S1-C subfamily serine protease